MMERSECDTREIPKVLQRQRSRAEKRTVHAPAGHERQRRTRTGSRNNPRQPGRRSLYLRCTGLGAGLGAIETHRTARDSWRTRENPRVGWGRMGWGPESKRLPSTRSPVRTRFEAAGALAEPFPQASIERAGALGLESVQSHVVPQVAAAVREFLDSFGWGSATSELGKAKEGVTQLRALAKEHMRAPEFAETAAETVSLFATQAFVNPLVLRYVRVPIDPEPCLVESFPEGEESVTDLLKALALPGRRGLARATIENALLLHGPAVLKERLALDPREFRLVCIPPDLYLRVGRERGWGQRPQWTHFDGYRVLQSGRLLALVGATAATGDSSISAESAPRPGARSALHPPPWPGAPAWGLDRPSDHRQGSARSAPDNPDADLGRHRRSARRRTC